MRILYIEKAFSDLCLFGAFLTALGTAFQLPWWATSSTAVAISAAYLIFCAVKKRWVPEYDKMRQFLIPSISIYAIIIIFITLGGKSAELSKLSMPLFLMWLMLTILLMQAFRHEKPAELGSRYHFINLLFLLAIGVLGWAVSTKAFWLGVKWVLNIIWTYIFKGIVYLLVQLVYWIIFGISWLIQLIVNGKPPRELTEPGFQMDLRGSSENVFGKIETTSIPAWLNYILIVLGVIAFLFIAFMIIRRFAGGRSMGVDQSTSSQVSILPNDKRKKWTDLNVPLNNRDKVRYCWRQLQRLCEKTNVDVGENALSAEITQAFIAKCPDTPIRELRAIWLPARYSSAPVSSLHVRAARKALREIRSAVRNNNS